MGEVYTAYLIKKLTLSRLAELIFSDNEKKGFHAKDKTIPLDLMLMVSELSEALEEFRDGREPTEVYYKENNPEKPEGIPVEIADLLIRLLHFVAMHKIPIEEVLALKLNYNKTRPYKHGRNS